MSLLGMISSAFNACDKSRFEDFIFPSINGIYRWNLHTTCTISFLPKVWELEPILKQKNACIALVLMRVQMIKTSISGGY